MTHHLSKDSPDPEIYTPVDTDSPLLGPDSSILQVARRPPDAHDDHSDSPAPLPSPLSYPSSPPLQVSQLNSSAIPPDHKQPTDEQVQVQRSSFTPPFSAPPMSWPNNLSSAPATPPNQPPLLTHPWGPYPQTPYLPTSLMPRPDYPSGGPPNQTPWLNHSLTAPNHPSSLSHPPNHGLLQPGQLVNTVNGLTTSENVWTNAPDYEICKECKARSSGRNLILAIDGTSNQFGSKNTNVVELYARIEKSEKQLTYYNSGIGTFANPSRKLSWAYLRMVAENKIDLAIAWNFEKIILAAYRWLSDNFRPGDQIFLFGFSRGAYQVKTLAALIQKVGLILPGNEEQIPFAYELYVDTGGNLSGISKAHPNGGVNPVAHQSNRDMTTEDMATRFKETFSRPHVQVHFIGIWDCVSSVGIFRGKTLPLTNTFNHMCYFRHALALDERRVKFLPECVLPSANDNVKGGRSSPKKRWWTSEMMYEEGYANDDWNENGSTSNTADNDTGGMEAKSELPPHVKEVWFAGCHSDIGGGVKDNSGLNLNDIPALWMANEAMMAGLRLNASKVDGQWDMRRLRDDRPTESLRWLWWLLEFLPLKRPRDHNPLDMTWNPHRAKGRRVHNGQKIHASVLFKHGYTPKANFSEDYQKLEWGEIIGSADQYNISWGEHLKDVLEMDLYDCTAGGSLIAQLKDVDVTRANAAKDILDRLYFIAYFDVGTKSIMEADREFKVLLAVLNDGHLESQVRTLEILGRASKHRFCSIALWETDIPVKLAEIAAIEGNDKKMEVHAMKTMVQLFQLDPQSIRPKHVQVPRGVEHLYSSHLASEVGNIIVRSLNCEEPVLGATALVMALNNPTIRDAFIRAKAGGVAELVRKLDNEYTHVCMQVARGLGNLAQYDDVQTAILETDAINLIVEMVDVGGRGVLLSTLRKLPEFEKHWHGFTKDAAGGRTRLARAVSFLTKTVRLASVSKMSQPDVAPMILETDPIDLLKADNIELEDILNTMKVLKGNTDKDGPSQPDILQRISEALNKPESGQPDPGSTALISEFLRWLVNAVRREKSEVQRSGFDSLSRLAARDRLRAQILDTNILQLARTNETYIQDSYSLLSQLAEHYDSRPQLLRTDIVAYLDRMPKNSNEGIQACTRLLSKLAKYPDSRAQIVGTDIFRSLARLAMTIPDYYFLLSELTKYDDSRAQLLKTDIVISLNRMLKSSDEDMHVPCIRLLLKLAKYTDSRAQIFDTDIFQSLARLAKRLPDFYDLLLSELMEHDESRAQLLKTDIVISLNHMLKNSGEYMLKSSGEHMLKSSGEHVLKSSGEHPLTPCIHLLSKLAKYDDSRVQIFSPDIFQSAHLETRMPDNYVLLLSELIKHDDSRAQLRKTDIVNSLDCMLKWSDDSEVALTSCIQLLSELAEYADLRAHVFETDLMQSLAHKTLNINTFEPYHRLVLKLAFYEDSRAQLLQADLISLLISGLDKGGEQMTRNYALLLSLAEYESFKDQMPQAILDAPPFRKSESFKDQILRKARDAPSFPLPSTLTTANFPVMYPGTLYTGTPYVPPMDAFTPAAMNFNPSPDVTPSIPSPGGHMPPRPHYTGHPTSTQWAASAGPYQQTPYAPPMHPPVMQPQTDVNQFQQPLPAASGGPGWGPQPQQQTPWDMPSMTDQWPRQTPWSPGAPLPQTGQGGPGGQGGPSSHWHPQQRGAFQGLSERFYLSRPSSDSDELDLANKVRFSIGPHYGPVLEPFLVKAVKADVRINPLLHPPEDDLKRPFIQWNMLFPTSKCHRSTDRQGRSWARGRDEPATFPRVTTVRIICRGLPWMTTITARNPSVGVTCGELIDTISDSLYRHVSKAEMQSTPNSRDIISAYWHNRSTEADDVPGGRLGDGVRRIDWLLYNSKFCGIVKNDDLARAQCGGEVLPCTFELKCESRFDPDQQLKDQDRRDREERELNARRSTSTSRPSSRASSPLSII